MAPNSARVFFRAHDHAVRPWFRAFEEDEFGALAPRRRVEGFAPAVRSLDRDDEIERLLLDLDQIGARLLRDEAVRRGLIGTVQGVQRGAERQ